MFFIYCVFAYILGLFTFYFALTSWLLIIILSLVLIITMIINYLCKHNSLFHLIILLFFNLGVLVAFCHNYYNNTLILKQTIKGIYAYAEIYKIEQSSYNSTNYIYLNNLIFNTVHLPNDQLKINQLPNRIKIKYRHHDLLEIHDIVRGNFYLFPPSSALYPHGFDFAKNAFYKQISANGFVLGKLAVIDNFHQNNLYDKLFLNLQLLKQKIINEINLYANHKIAPFLIAITIGESSFLPKDINNLRKTSLAHLISISGYHIGLISGLLFVLIRFLLVLNPQISLRYNIKQITALLCILALIFYGLLVGHHDPALRAIIMGIAVLLGIILKFNVFSMNALFLAIFIILIFKPYNLYSASFLLSSVATYAVICLWNNKYIQTCYCLSKKHWYYKIIFFIIATMVTSFFVELLIAPILAFYFQTIPIIGILANLIAEPIFAFAIMPSIVIYMISPIIIGKYFIMLASFLMELILNLAEKLANLPYISISTPFFPDYLMYSYLLVLMLFCLQTKYLAYAGALAITLMITWYILTPAPDVIIADSFNLVAIKTKNNQYALSNNKNKFISQVWFKNKAKLTNQPINQQPEFHCELEHCVWQQDNKIISFSQSAKYYLEDCGVADLILLSVEAPYQCTYGITLDKNYLKKHGATFIYLKPKIKIHSNH